MFDVKELEFIKEVLKETESQDETTLGLLEKINEELEIVANYKDYKELLWKFYWYYGRQGEVEGVFKATREEINKAIGNEVYFGEILGKHSEVGGVLEENDFELLSDNSLYVINATESGYNPLEYIRYECSKCGNTYSVDEFYDLENIICDYCNNDTDSE